MATYRSPAQLVRSVRDAGTKIVVGAVSASALCYGVIQVAALMWSLRPAGAYGLPHVARPVSGTAEASMHFVLSDIGTLIMFVAALACIFGGMMGASYALQRGDSAGQRGGSENE